MSEDQRLLRLLHRGDTDALCSIYEKYKNDLLTIAISVLGDIHASEDCLHDVFVGFAKDAGRFRVRRSLKGYLICSIINRARNQLKKRQNRSICQIEELDLATTSNNPAA